MLDEVAVKVAEGHLLMGVGGVVVVELLLLTTAQKDEMLRLARVIPQDACIHPCQIAVAHALDTEAEAADTAGHMEHGGAQEAA